MNKTAYKSIDQYIATFPKDVLESLTKIRKLIHETAPGVTEKISYNMPAFNLNGKYLVYFAGYAKHIGFYPISTSIPEFKEELANYKTGKGSIQFPLDKPIPYDLIKRIVEYRLKVIKSNATN